MYLTVVGYDEDMAVTWDAQRPIKNVDLDTLRSAVEASRSPLIITDNQQPDNPIIYSNKAFQELTGYPMKSIIGKNCRFLQGDDSDKEAIKTLRDAVHNNQFARVTLKNYKKDGTPFWNDLVMSPITNDSGVTTHFIGMQLDITERMESAEKLQAKTNELERSNQELEQFTYTTSHDLQEPLRMISSYLQLFNRRYGDKLDNDAETFLGYATEGAERMQSLIYDLLTLSRVTTNQEKLKCIPMEQVVERALFNLKVSIDEQKAKVIVDPLPELAVDAVQMTQLFQNLVSNALKYRQKKVRPEIHISAEKQGDDYEFSVADNGIGIAKQFHQRIFQVFQRLHTRAEYTGTGVGLAICSKIVDRHGGRLWVESDVGKGATFKFTIPENTRKKAA